MNDKTHDLKCLICDAKKQTQNGMLYHLRSAHKKKMVIDTTWKWAEPKSAAELKKVAKSKKKVAKKKVKKTANKKSKAPTQVVMPNSQYIDIPVILRIPISIGQVSILQPD